MRFIIICLTLAFFSTIAKAQNFEPARDKVQDKIEKSLSRFGTIQRVFLDDKEKKTFIGQPGKEYIGWFVYDKNSAAVRRMMIIQQGTQGEKVKIHYPKFNQAVSDIDKQGFAINFIAPSDVTGPITYRVDASPEATVYLYEVTRGFKRD
jgi:hypothetical protein